ncbi:MAG: lytic transglycosylase domain-containing protein [Bryobacteraceae bacterium]
MLLLAGAVAAFGQTSPSAKLALGIDRFEQKRYAEAVQNLDAARLKLPQLADYAAYYLASAHSELKDYGKVALDLAPFQQMTIVSPLRGRAYLLEAKALVETGAASQAIALLRSHSADLPQPLGDLGLAQAYEAAGDRAHAAAFYQRVYFQYPATDAASRGMKALEGLRLAMGENYPPPMAQQMLERGDRLIRAREYVRARDEFSLLIPKLGGADAEVAQVRMGAAQYFARQTPLAFHYLQSLRVSSPEADAERLYYIVECSRRIDNDAAIHEALEHLTKYPQSPWRLKALLSAGNRYLLSNKPAMYIRIYQACADSFPGDAEAAYCSWKVAFHSHMERRKDSDSLLKQHVTRYGKVSSASSALYFLGRHAEGARDFGAAKAYYTALTERFPGYYYGILARERLAQASVVKAQPSAAAVAFLGEVVLPVQPEPASYEASPATRRRTERGKLLAAAGLSKLAEAELRFGARTDGQPHLMAMELARTAAAPHQGLRHMKSLVTDYFSMAPDVAPQRFWEALFPLPYRSDLVKSAGATDLDPHMLAGVVRQESEFNPMAISRAKAYGLTQILPGTGKELARRAGIKQFSTPMLFQPATNLKLGSYYLRMLLDQWGGKWEETLASYNAGKGRVIEWLKWGEFREPAEFVETIPFTETREYVQSVVRNAAVYRRVYGNKMSAGTETPEPTVAAVAKPAPRASVRRASLKHAGPIKTKKRASGG